MGIGVYGSTLFAACANGAFGCNLDITPLSQTWNSADQACFQVSSLDLSMCDPTADIGNSNGFLKCTAGSGFCPAVDLGTSCAMPTGPFTSSCLPLVQGNILYGACQNGNLTCGDLGNPIGKQGNDHMCFDPVFLNLAECSPGQVNVSTYGDIEFSCETGGGMC